MRTRTQGFIFTLFGDYISHRADTVWVGALIELLGALGVSEQAVRSTASRMVHKGWLRAERRGRISYYAMTPRMAGLLQTSHQQIRYPAQDGWDGHWYVVAYALHDDLDAVRGELRKRLSRLGFGRLTSGAWISPHDRRSELIEILDSLNIRPFADYFRADHILPGDGRSLAGRCWHLAGLDQRYRRFIQKYQPQFESDCLAEQKGDALSPESAFRQRFWLVYEYRHFPTSDPYLPRELLPEDWQGDSAVSLFRAYHDLLRDGANAYVDGVLAYDPDVTQSEEYVGSV